MWRCSPKVPSRFHSQRVHSEVKVKPASMRQPLVCLHLVANARHCRFSCAGNRPLCWRAALIRVSPRTTPTPALLWSDPQAASEATETHTWSQFKTNIKWWSWENNFSSLWRLPCRKTFSPSLPRVQPDSREKNCQIENRGWFQCVGHIKGTTGCLTAVAVLEEFQQWRRFTNLIAYGSSILGGSKRWLLHSFTLSTTLLLNKCTSLSYLEKQNITTVTTAVLEWGLKWTQPPWNEWELQRRAGQTSIFRIVLVIVNSQSGKHF